jgi:hypothetical protein
VFCGTGDNKRKEVLTFEVASFDIGYNCIIRRHFLLKFMAVIHTIYAILKMSGPKDVITIKAGRFGKKAPQEQAAKIAKTHDGSISIKSPAPKPSTIDSP